jgi:glycerol kinase
MRWLLEHNENVAWAQTEGTLVMGPLVGCLAWHLLGGQPLIVDRGHAARS